MSEVNLNSESIKKPYSERSIEDQIVSNWKKTIGLYRRGEYSTVVIRAATSVELAANMLIRKELIEKQGLPTYFVESLMKWANGLVGKIDKILIPFLKDTEKEKDLNIIKKRTKDINDERNNVVHKGQFKAKSTALRVIEESEYIINSFFKISGADFAVVAELDEEDEDT